MTRWNTGEVPRIGFLHTAQVHVATFEALVRATESDSSCVHLVEPDLLVQARRNIPRVDVEDATLAGLRHLADDGAEIIVCTCSTLGPVAEALEARTPVPVLRVDRPMAQAAIRAGSRIGVIAALESTLEPTRALLATEARREGASPTIINVAVPDAWAAFESGDSDGYLRQVAEAARSIAHSVDVVVLAQASMMGATAGLTDLQTPVLASPVLAVQHALSVSSR
jgi:Asp/Glu/hydantoin racemase